MRNSLMKKKYSKKKKITYLEIFLFKIIYFSIQLA